MTVRGFALALVLCVSLVGQAHAADFDAAVGRTGYGRCHMDECGFFIIDASVPVGVAKDGVLFALSSRVWSADYKQTSANDDHEYDRPPVGVSPKTVELSMVFCSKTRPVLFNFNEGKWESGDLRPGDEASVFGANESAYQFYYAACHHYITHDPVSKEMALKLGYKFATAPGADGTILSSPPKQPLDMLK